MRPLIALTMAVSAAALTAPARADTPDGPAFVAAFAEACIPERLSYEGALAHVARLGWAPLVAGEDTEADGMVAVAVAEMERELADPEFDFEGELSFFARTVEGRPYTLAVSKLLSDYIDIAGCYLYDFAATEPIDPTLVGALLEIEPAYATDGDDPFFAGDPAELVSVVWGPPPGLPRTMDTYLTFIPEGSPAVEKVGFDGLVLKFSTSLPNPEREARYAEELLLDDDTYDDEESVLDDDPMEGS